MIVAVSSSVVVSTASAEGEAAFEHKQYVADVPRLGLLTLELHKEYRGQRQATLGWLGLELRCCWELHNDQLLVYRQPTYANKVPDLALVLQPVPDGTLQVVDGGVVDAHRIDFFGSLTWKPANDFKSTEYKRFYQARDQKDRLFERGELKPLPDSFPPEFVDATALLCRDREHELIAILRHPKLSSAVLDSVGEALIKNEAGQGSYFVRAILAAHPNISPDLQDHLFSVTNEPTTWRAVAGNPVSQGKYSAEYLDRIRRGDNQVAIATLRDQLAPRGAWEIALAAHPEAADALAENKKAPPELLEKIANSPALRNPSQLARNPQTPAVVLEKLSYSTDKQILWALEANPAIPADTLQRVLRTLATAPHENYRDTVARDPRLPEDLMLKLSKDPSLQVRIVLAMNPAVPLQILEHLAQDPYGMVSERARENIKKRFPSAHAAQQAQWTPTEKLNPHMSLAEEFIDAVKTGSMSRARELLVISDDPEMKPSYKLVVATILRENFDAGKDLLREALKADDAKEEFVANHGLKRVQVIWAVKEKLLEPRWIERLALSATQYGNEDALLGAKETGLLTNISQRTKDQALFSATASRLTKLVEFWLAEGARANQPVEQGLSATDVAGKMYSIEVLKRLDTKGKYASVVASATKNFPPAPGSKFLGHWSNKRDGFNTVAFVLSADGTGSMGAGIVGGPILWAEESPDSIRLVMVGPHGPMKEKPVIFRYHVERDAFTMEKAGERSIAPSDEKAGPFYRIKQP